MEEAKSRINEYSEKEFGDEADFSDLSHVPLAFTTDEDNYLSIEVYADLLDYKIVTRYDDKTVSEEKYDSLENMLGTLGNLEFDELVALGDEEKIPISEDKLTEREMLDMDSYRASAAQLTAMTTLAWRASLLR